MNKKQTELSLEFDDNQLLARLVGEQNSHLKYLEKQLGVGIHLIGNTLSITGSATKCKKAQEMIADLYHKLEDGIDIENGEFEGIIRLKKQISGASPKASFDAQGTKIQLKSSDREIHPRSKQ